MDYAVIMAGGTGKRLWPLSRKGMPKQVLKLVGGKTLLRHCFDRLSPIFRPENIIVLTNAAYVDMVRENLREVPAENVIAEPAVRDTCGAIGLAATILNKKDSDATMAIVTADHIISPVEVFQQTIKDAIRVVNDNPNTLVTFGIQPTYAATQYGYIKCVNSKAMPGCENSFYTVEAFKEKPDEVMAGEYVVAGDYFWNGGMFVWKAGTILANLTKFVPQTVEPLGKIAASWGAANQQAELEKWFLKLPKISIDYAVMEKADDVWAIKLDCNWKDVGAFEELAGLTKPDENGNVVIADKTVFLGSGKNIVITEDKGHLIALVGMENVIVAHTADATLICQVGESDRLKELLEQIEKDGLEEYL